MYVGKCQAHTGTYATTLQYDRGSNFWTFVSSYEVTSTKLSRSLVQEFATGGAASVFLVR